MPTTSNQQPISSPAIILVRPQLGGNIGAVARAMSNFGLSDLRLVAPTNGWPNEHAYDMATVSAAPILDAARIYESVGEALSGIHFAYATTARQRHMEKQVFEPEDAMRDIRGHLAEGLACAIVFGPERTGLENDDIVRCDAIVTIPTGSANSSLNLGQSSVVLGYAWHRSGEVTSPARPAQSQPPAAHEETEAFFSQLEGYLDTLNYFRTPEKKPLMWQNLRNIFLRAQMNEQELRTLRGLVRDLYKRRPLKP